MTVILCDQSVKDVALADHGTPLNLGCRLDGICYYESSSYQFPTMAEWRDASNACEQDGYVLPILNNQDRKDWFTTNIINKLSEDSSTSL